MPLLALSLHIFIPSVLRPMKESQSFPTPTRWQILPTNVVPPV
jgi:hypothetical protein